MSELGLFGALETKINIEQERYLHWYLPYQKKKNNIYIYTHTHQNNDVARQDKANAGLRFCFLGKQSFVLQLGSTTFLQ